MGCREDPQAWLAPDAWSTSGSQRCSGRLAPGSRIFLMIGGQFSGDLGGNRISEAPRATWRRMPRPSSRVPRCPKSGTAALEEGRQAFQQTALYYHPKKKDDTSGMAKEQRNEGVPVGAIVKM